LPCALIAAHLKFYDCARLAQLQSAEAFSFVAPCERPKLLRYLAAFINSQRLELATWNAMQPSRGASSLFGKRIFPIGVLRLM